MNFIFVLLHLVAESAIWITPLILTVSAGESVE